MSESFLRVFERLNEFVSEIVRERLTERVVTIVRPSDITTASVSQTGRKQ